MEKRNEARLQKGVPGRGACLLYGVLASGGSTSEALRIVIGGKDVYRGFRYSLVPLSLFPQRIYDSWWS